MSKHIAPTPAKDKEEPQGSIKFIILVSIYQECFRDPFCSFERRKYKNKIKQSCLSYTLDRIGYGKARRFYLDKSQVFWGSIKFLPQTTKSPHIFLLFYSITKLTNTRSKTLEQEGTTRLS